MPGLRIIVCFFPLNTMFFRVFSRYLVIHSLNVDIKCLIYISTCISILLLAFLAIFSICFLILCLNFGFLTSICYHFLILLQLFSLLWSFVIIHSSVNFLKLTLVFSWNVFSILCHFYTLAWFFFLYWRIIWVFTRRHFDFFTSIIAIL